MRAIIYLTFSILLANAAFAQQADSREVSKTDLQNFNKIIDREVITFKKKLTEDGVTGESVIFSIDTFRIQRIMAMSMDINYTTIGMNDNVNNMTIAYDKLMNKYYKKLLNKLKGNDKKDLIKAQANWLAFRNAETSLIYTLGNTEYSGGGTIQSNIAMGAKSDLTIKRTEVLFNYYANMEENL